jgi:hypothetical protein
MILIAAPLPKNQGIVVFLPETIGGCVTDISNKSHTVVYTDTFPDGVTIAMDTNQFAEQWQTALALEDVEIEFTPDEVPEVLQ